MSEPLEKEEQKALVRHLRSRNVLVASIPNGGNRDVQYVRALIDEGLLAGMTDLIIALDKGRTLWVEMKRRTKGALSIEQKLVHARLRELGHVVILGRGAKDAMEQIKEYL